MVRIESVKKVRLSVTIDERVMDYVQDLAKEFKTTLSNVVNTLLGIELEQKGEAEAKK